MLNPKGEHILIVNNRATRRRAMAIKRKKEKQRAKDRDL